MQTLGLMTTDLPKRTEQGTAHPTWERLALAGLAAGCQVIFFHPHRIDLTARRVTGCIYIPERGWRFGRGPLPSVVIDNVFVHVARHDTAYAANKQGMQRAGIEILNPRLPDKWGVWRALRHADDLREHLPATAPLRQMRDIDRWLDHCPSVFVKPVRGSGGNGVLEIKRAEQGGYQVSGADANWYSEDDLQALLRHRLAGEKHLLQQGLSLIEVDGHKIDLRVVLHRDGGGEWQPIATVPRMAAKGQALTNLAQGGEVRSLDWLQGSCPLPEREEIERVAIRAAQAVTAIRPTLAFAGIDIALDTDGRLWTLDFNPRPGRKVLSPDDRSLAFRHLVDFAKTLLG